MFKNILEMEPTASSTPKNVFPRGRSRIRGENVSPQSDIGTDSYQITEGASQKDFYRIPEGASQKDFYRIPESASQKDFYRIPESASQKDFYHTPEREAQESNSCDDFEVNEEIDSSTGETAQNTKWCNCITLVQFTFIILLIVVAVGLGFVQNSDKLEKKLADKFPSQVKDFWIYIEEGIEDVNRFQRPKTFVFLYNEDGQETLEKILKSIGESATCKLTDCSSSPIELNASDLSTSDILKDYGKVIARYKAKLENSGVMIIKNLEKVPGASAQAFHSFCDEFNPIIKKALFIFTMKVDRFHENNLKFVENYLHDHWNDIDEDKFYPLFTRIANVVLPVTVENQL